MIPWIKRNLSTLRRVLPHTHSFSDWMRVEESHREEIYPGVFWVNVKGTKTCLDCKQVIPCGEMWLEMPWFPGMHMLPTEEAWRMIYEEIGHQEVARWQATRSG